MPKNHQPSHGEEFDRITASAAETVLARLAILSRVLTANDDPADFVLAVVTKLMGRIAEDNNKESLMLIMEKATVDKEPGWKAKFAFDYLDADPDGLFDIDNIDK